MLAHLSVEARARLLVEVLLGYRDQGKYLLHEFVVMPDHVHLVLTPRPEISLELAVQFIIGGYSYRLRKVEKIQGGRRALRITGLAMRRIMRDTASMSV